MPEQQSAAAGLVGHVVAGHRIDAVLGEGGMGVVYRATHLRLHRPVALKVLPPPLAADQDYRRRFEREAAIAASLEHPNVIPIYDAGHANGLLYLSMRFVDGEDLGALLRREGPLSGELVCAVLGPVADALDAVHEAGLVHRDVKPGNVLIARTVRPNGHRQVYLCDFGIAKNPTSGGPDLTSAGQYIGTLQYSSPEQIEGRWLDGRSDQYGLACLVYRALTGQVPYPRDDTSAVIYAHLAGSPPRPTELRPDLPPAVDGVVARAAAKHPDHRFPTCSAFVAALRAALAPAPRPRPRPAPVPQGPPPAPVPRPGRSLPPTLPLPSPSPPDRPTRPAEPDEASRVPAAETVAVQEAEPPARLAPAPPSDVRAERIEADRSITVTWTPGSAAQVEYKVSRRTPDGRWQVVGRTAANSIVDGAVAPDAAIPVYGVVARLGTEVSDLVESVAQPAAAPPAPVGIPPVRNLTATAAGPLLFEWPAGVTEAMVVVRADRAPESPADPAATAWKITNMRYQLDGGLRLPPSVPRPCHVAVASCERAGTTLVVAPAFDASAHAVVPR
ncbi:protein kinase domain-containing protein [Pseudonocardia sp. CA-107938]|uniref:serine/threonine-protein kinase n=1 Tax=Pseudonocardia sp. CA-107938 TaxID=3240021 RepID=UPI003D8E06F7